MTVDTSLRRVTVPSILTRKSSSSKITALTAYDYTFASLFDRTGIDIILVGDSLASVVQGLDTTLPVTLDEMIYHSRCVVRGVSRALVVGDMPFLSYQVSVEKAVESAGRILKEAGVGAVKLEGGVYAASVIERLTQIDIPVMGHVGLTPQSYHRMGGHKIQGKQRSGACTDSKGRAAAGSRERVIEDALAVQQAGAFSVVLEGIPHDLASEITELLAIPTIGIAAGPHCDGQILVSTDLLGLNPERCPEFVKQFGQLADVAAEAVALYMHEVQSGAFPKKKVRGNKDKKEASRLRIA